MLAVAVDADAARFDVDHGPGLGLDLSGPEETLDLADSEPQVGSLDLALDHHRSPLVVAEIGVEVAHDRVTELLELVTEGGVEGRRGTSRRRPVVRSFTSRSSPRLVCKRASLRYLSGTTTRSLAKPAHDSGTDINDPKATISSSPRSKTGSTRSKHSSMSTRDRRG